MGLFDINGQFMATLGKLADIILCSMMFCFFSLPIVTAGASLTALYSCMQLIVADEEEGLIFRHFWRSFRQNLKQATVLWLICLWAFAFLEIFRRIVWNMPGILGRSYRISFFVLCFVFLVGFQYIFPLQARYRNKVRFTLANAWLLGIAAFPWTVLSILLTAAAVYISIFMNPNTFNTAVYLWVVAGFGIVTYLNTFFFNQAFRKIDGTNRDRPQLSQK